VRAQERHEWVSHDQQEGLFELAGKTMVLVGVGAIGVRTAEVAAPFGMRVLGVRRDPTADAPGVEAMFGPDQLLDLLPQADFLVLTIPLTHETQGMIGEPELRAMKPTAYLINIGRGGTVQETVLIRALREGWIAGAGLDVFESEPLPQDSPLWEMENVIITAHYAGLTPYYNQRAMAIFLDNLRRYQAGEPMRNVVDKRLGY
jgi:phosphoglycerate dehydrogenase-like enzyme